MKNHSKYSSHGILVGISLILGSIALGYFIQTDAIEPTYSSESEQYNCTTYYQTIFLLSQHHQDDLAKNLQYYVDKCKAIQNGYTNYISASFLVLIFVIPSIIALGVFGIFQIHIAEIYEKNNGVRK